MKFVVLSDVHYISRRRMLPGTAQDVLIKPAASETALRMACEIEDADTILITGDLTDDGDLWSHEDLIAIFREMQAKGKKVFVTTATHDFHHGRAYTRCYNDTKVRYKSEPWHSPYFDIETADYRKLVRDEYAWLDDASITPKLVRCASPAELWELYADFGRNQAFSVCDEGNSYCVELDKNTWCLMLNDNFRNIEGRHNESVTYTPVCLQWMRDLVKRAQTEGKFLFACTHHPLVPPLPAYRIGADNRNMRESYVGHTLADIGIPLVFSGHTHFADVSFMKSDSGNLLCDITTPSVRHYPPQFSVVHLDAPENHVKIESIEVKTVDGFDLGDQTFKEYIRKNFEADYRNKFRNLPAPLNKLIENMQVCHVYPLVKKASGLTKEEYEQIKHRYIFDIIMDLVHNMLGGDGGYTPDTPIYKLMMGTAAVLDSLIDTQPFKNIKKDLLKGYSVREFMEPMLFNNFIPDSNADFNFTEEPQPRFNTPVYTSHAGEGLMAVLCLLALLLSKPVGIAAAVALPAMTYSKKMKNAKNPIRPERY